MILKYMMDQEVGEYIFPMPCKAKWLSARLKVEINGEKVSVNQQLLFQRLSVATSTKKDGASQESFAYELCSSPPALSDHKLFHYSGAKSKLSDAIWRQVDSEHTEKPTIVCAQRETDYISTDKAWVKIRQIIDGASLLHHIPWTLHDSKQCKEYVLSASHLQTR